MDIEKLISFFGMEYKNKEFIEFLSNYNTNVLNDIKIDRKIQNAYICNYKDGYEFIFKDESDFKKEVIIGESGNYYFINTGFYAQGYEGYEQYQGVLINGIKMTDNVEEIRNKLGDNYKRHDFLDVDIWENINGVKIFIDYKKKNTPQIISISLVR
ncbi:hypothetical protein [Aliarcobacter butzleri]|uniref:hypothetical protein n=1 Tax=Aliarcobacter butzleri TaxID=28197 RepID=UPI00125EDFF6|nr:hypothetical protein [Aliarcobacter butzleri]